MNHEPQVCLQTEALRMRAAAIFPDNRSHADKWLRAKLYLGKRKPAVDIGCQRVDTSRSVRSLRETTGLHHLG